MENKEIIQRKDDNSMVKFLRSNNFGSIIMIVSAMLQGFFSYFVFNKTTGFSNEVAIIVSLIYSITISAALLFYTLRGNTIMALVFLVFECGMNSFYDFIFVYPKNVQFFWMQLFIGLMIPVSSYFYVSEINKTVKTRIRNPKQVYDEND
jgi:hypothetical protein